MLLKGAVFELCSLKCLFLLVPHNFSLLFADTVFSDSMDM